MLLITNNTIVFISGFDVKSNEFKRHTATLLGLESYYIYPSWYSGVFNILPLNSTRQNMVQEGYSGSPLTDKTGSVVGMMVTLRYNKDQIVDKLGAITSQWLRTTGVQFHEKISSP